MALRDNGVFLFARDIGNITGSTGVQHGYINASHMSNITAGWTPSTLPSPFPLVIVSSLVSFILAYIGWKTAISTWVPPEKRTIRRPPDFENWTWRERWEWSKKRSRDAQSRGRLEWENAEAEHIPLRAPDETEPQKGNDSTRSNEPNTGFPFGQDFQPGYAASNARENAPASIPPASIPPASIPPAAIPPAPTPAPITRWQASCQNKILVILSVAYNTVRAIIAIAMTLDVTISRNGTQTAVSSLFLLYLSLQTFISNRKLPRLISLILVIDLFLVGLAFLIANWDEHTGHYGDATVMGGNCPVYASDCKSQARQWTRVGCGAALPPVTSAQDSDGDSLNPNPNYGDAFYPPYATASSIDFERKQNTLDIMEAVIGGCGTFWVVVTLLATLYEAVRAFGSMKSISHLWWPIPMEDEWVTNKKTGKRRRRLGWSAMSLFALFALGGAFIVTILSIAGHVSGETRTYTGTFIDSFGPAVNTNVTRAAGSGLVNSTAYWGNATSWSDCFTVTTPSSNNGFFKEWIEHNEQVAFRLVSLL